MRKELYTLICCCLIFGACEKTFEAELPVKPKDMVVNCQFTPGEPWVLELSHTRPVLSNEPIQKIKNANVQIFENGALIESLTYIETDRPGQSLYYGSTNLPEEGKEYKLRVFAPDFPLVTAVDEAPIAQTKIESFQFLQETPEGDNIFSLEFSDLQDGDNFYHIAVKQVQYQLEIDVDEADTTYSVVQELETRFQVGSDDPLTGFSIDPEAISLYNSRGFLLQDQEFNLDRRQLSLQIRGANEEIIQSDSTNTEKKAYGYAVELRSVSQAYFDYFDSIAEQTNTEDLPVIIPFEVSNNIEDGYGNFSGYSVVNSVVRLIP